MDKDIIKEITGFDIHVLTLNGENKVISFSDFVSIVNIDELVHTARSSSACFPVFQCTLSGHQCMYMD